MNKCTGGSLLLILTLFSLRYCLYPFHSTSPLPTKKTLIRHSPLPTIKLQGLNDLFSTPNFTYPNPNPKLIWAHMLPLLSRPDSLPGIADGVREASIAWKDLLVDIKGENYWKFEVEDRKKKCPFSVGGNGSVLEIPCGLVEDSAVTIVGVPIGKNGSGTFGFELVGNGNGDGELLPVVVRVNVSVGGDEVVVSQSSWRVESGWAEWEFCPGRRGAANTSNFKVDGLTRCNQKLGENVNQENLTRNSTDAKNPSERTKKSFLLSSGAPFVEGNPFTATLWAGMEGFHMTVNGRHETSYLYRERLEPWLVSKVLVDGDLDLMSILVNGLPVSEDIDLIGDIQRLKAPPLRKRRLFMLVGIFSSGNNFERRMAIRRSWMQYEAVRSGDVAIRFLTGLHKNKQVNLELWEEARTYGDIQLMPFVDYYSLITLKTVAVCILGTEVIPAKYIMKTDDDAFVRIDEVLASLKRSVSHGLLYGQISFESSPERDKDSKWFISPAEWPHETYPPWAHGPGYIISRDIAKFIVRGHRERILSMFKLEDVAMGIWIQEYKKRGQEVNYTNDARFHNAGCEADYILAHYQGPRLLLCLWEKLQKEHHAICCE